MWALREGGTGCRDRGTEGVFRGEKPCTGGGEGRKKEWGKEGASEYGRAEALGRSGDTVARESVARREKDKMGEKHVECKGMGGGGEEWGGKKEKEKGGGRGGGRENGRGEGGGRRKKRRRRRGKRGESPTHLQPKSIHTAEVTSMIGPSFVIENVLAVIRS